ncbi:restriction endonuclease subunit R [Lysobacter concretionis Ko07 = DSM 16239]|uniref:Restriction endonuclease subunit R n=1 Tax=Lysobacter concretionis Ko07 = DSM 16239 TaxID=1122185 RepID=A0A0A0EQR8_9GAMM|nr:MULTISPECIES: DEAD/DEAH box helicase family protein [Lysobacter]KGM52503.1 restriction endonuclease subunit R [Lysobacter concretionis Ko07 = DSM 16239]QOD91743.1 DEAD/DEAH box helicase family protein [Lysobacter sp. CW239]
MSNFNFLRAEFKPIYEPARGAEQLVHSDPRACCMRTRHALEQAVHWLYAHDLTLRMPYDNSLGVLLTQPAFEQLLPPHIHQKARLIQKLGNQAVHGSGRIGSGDAMRLVRELFHVLFWLARTYTRASDPKSIEASFDDKQVPHLVRADEAVSFTRDELAKQEAQFRQQIETKHAEVEAREARIAETAATLAEREAALAEVNARLAQARAELAQAKTANIAVPDGHDYHEADTRKFFIDVLLREAGWIDGDNLSFEVPVTGMPNQKGEGFVDYVLWGRDGKPLAVVEAKRTFTDPDVGRQQAKLYADCLERMKGQRPLIFYTNGHKTWLWDDRRAPPREVQGFYTREELELAIQRRSLQQDLRGLKVDREIAGREYQLRAIRAMAESLASGRRAGLLTMATGTGKTRMSIALVELLMRANWVKRVLFLADRVALVNQAAKAFKEHLPHSSPVNLVTEKDGQGRVYLSTYPTMMGLIEQMQGDRRKYGVGHFDLIIIDEAHRSVYQKYGAIFRYFDSYLVGLTATPRDEVDRDTYHLFGLETGVPTDTYGLDEAVADGYLVPPKAHSVPIRFVREGIRYDELSDEEKEHWESLDWGEHDELPDEVHASQVNKQLFNESTVDLMLQHLMEHGLKVDGGDTLGKTIIFAVNQRHAEFIAQRFDHHYPHYKGAFARVVTHSVTYAQSLIDDFSRVARLPQIAISVDMLDTGIDVPEIVNLVFFKAVRSKVKFLQMIGRGTRLCPALFGPGQDKTEFHIFDFCQNFEYFNEHPAGAVAPVSEPLGKRLFKRRLELVALLPTDPDEKPKWAADGVPDYGSLPLLRHALVDQLHGEVAAMNLDNFIVRTELEHVTRFAERGQWDALDDTAIVELREHVAGLPSEQEAEHITAKLFDLVCVNLQVALIKATGDFITWRDKVIGIASDLETKDTIPAVKAQLALIQELQTEAFWQGITLPLIETVRRKIRELVKFVDQKTSTPVYTVLTDEIGEASEVGLDSFSTGINLAQYKRKVEAYIRANDSHIAIAKLRHNKPLTPTDLEELERFVYGAEVVGGRAAFEKHYGSERPLTLFIRSLVGLDRNAAKEAFAHFLDENRYTVQQIRFVEMVIDRLTHSGVMDPGQLYEPPFTAIHYEGVEGAFGDADADAIFQIVSEINQRAAA